jgi:ionotropic kainate glutamate receptor 2
MGDTKFPSTITLDAPQYAVLQAGLHGLTGHIEFNEGKRSNFKLDLLKLKREELRTVGYWSPGMGINVTDPTAFYESSVTNITLVVMTREVRILSLDVHKCTLPGKNYRR